MLVNLRVLIYGNMALYPTWNLEECRLCYRISIVDATLMHGIEGHMMLSRKRESGHG